MPQTTFTKPGALAYLPKYYFVLGGIALLMVFYLGIELFVNHRFAMVDFEVYYKAAGRIWQGENLYRMASLEEGGDGFFRYKYAPTAALFFLPFALFPFKIAAALYWLLLTGILILSLHWMIRWAFPRQYPIPAYRLPLLPFLAALCVGVHVEAELHLGQVNLLLTFAYIVLLGGFVDGWRHRWLSLLWAATLFVKPYALIFLPYFILLRQWRLVQGLLFWTALLLLLPYFFYGNAALWWQQHGAWIEELRIQLAAKQSLEADKIHTVFSVLVRYTPLAWLQIDQHPIVKIGYQLLVLMGIGFLFLKTMRHNPYGMRAGHILHGALLIGWIPLLAQTDKNAFIFELPAVMVLLLYWRSLPFGWKMAGALGLLFCGGNIRDLWRPALASYWDQLSLVAIGALAILATVFALLLRKERK